MTAIAVSAGQFAAALLIGLELGAVYELLRPLRPRLTAISDGLFVACLLTAWVHLAFGICGGDIRMAQTAGLFLGMFFFRLTLGKFMERILARLLAPGKTFLKKHGNCSKNYLHLGKNRLQ